MKKMFVVAIVYLLLSTTFGFGQYYADQMGYMGQEGGLIMGGIGITTIDSEGESETYFSINLRPEVAFGKLGIGLNVNLLYNMENGAIRSKDWDEGYDYFRLLRYIRWGFKNDPVYARVGTLDAARLGHGFIVNYYTNEASYDNRKIGVAFDLDFGKFGFETIASNLGRAELVGIRGYYRPLYGVVDIPIIKNLAVGGTFARDFDPDRRDTTDDGVSSYGFDVELPVIKTRIFNTMLYYDWAQIRGYSTLKQETKTFGSGQAVGVMATLGNLMGILDLQAKLERRWLGERFTPAFFNPFYEIQRYTEEGYHKIDTAVLPLTGETKGLFGELYGNLLGNKVRLLGMFSRLDDVRESGTMHLVADAPDLIPTIAAHATYDKIGIETMGDVFTLDNHSVARVGVGYKIKPYLILYMDYIWTFVETQPGSNTYQPQERIEPKLVFQYQF